MPDRSLRKTYLHVPQTQPQVIGYRKLWRYLVGSILSPFYWLAAHWYHTPGLQFHLRCAWLGLRLLIHPKAPIASGWPYHLFFLPMDSTRYFEFDFMWNTLSHLPIQRYLDVSSPRLFPLLLVDKQRTLLADLINPDSQDINITANLVRASGLGGRCRLHSCLLEAINFGPEVFDVVTSISVLEHIPQDTRAIQTMLTALKPGGRLLLSVPCAAEASEQYIDFNEYGLLKPDEHGFVFWQRFYDQALLEERIFDVAGPPTTSVVYGEKTAGSFAKNAERKRIEFFTTYPFWREPYMMGQEYDYFNALADLPGEGVIALEFRKPQ
jgi:SAM-dependent methyltransferase